MLEEQTVSSSTALHEGSAVVDWTPLFEYLSKNTSKYVVQSATPTSVSVIYDDWSTSDVSRAKTLFNNMPVLAKEKLMAPIREGLLDATTFLRLRDPETGELVTACARDILDETEDRHISSETFLPVDSNSTGNSLVTNEILEVSNIVANSSIPMPLRQALAQVSGNLNSSMLRIRKWEDGEYSLQIVAISETENYPDTSSPNEQPHPEWSPLPPTRRSCYPSMSLTEASSIFGTFNVPECEDSEMDYESTTYESSVATCFETPKFIILLALFLVGLFVTVVAWFLRSNQFATAVSGDPMACDERKTYSKNPYYSYFGFGLSGASLVSFLILLILSVAARIPAVMSINILRKLIGPANFYQLIGLPYLISISGYFFFFAIFLDRALIDTSDIHCSLVAAAQYACLLKIVSWSIFKGVDIISHFYAHRKIGRLTKETLGRPYVAFSVCLAIPLAITISLFVALPTFFHPNKCFCWINSKFAGYAVILPMFLLAGGGIIFAILIINIFFVERRERIRRVGLKTYSNQKRQFKQEIFVFLSMLIMVTFPWLVQWFTYDTVNLTMFFVCVDLQGVILCAVYLMTRCSCRI